VGIGVLRELRPGDPRLIGPYRLVGNLGDGGMGRVFLGRSAGGRPVAVKVIRSDLAADPDFRSRFRREVAAARRVSGLFTAMVVDADVDAPEPWLATAYVAGPSLAEAVREQGPLPVSSVLALAAGLAESLVAIHAAGVVHRDLKPSNVLLGQDGPCVIDFGISRATEQTSLTRVGFVIGSPGFMSPEQAEGHEVGPPSDIFSLGAVLAFAATGNSPFGAGSTAALVYRIVYAPPNLEGVPEEVLPLVERCLIKDPAQRPTASELLSEAEAVQPATGWLPEPFTRTFPDSQELPVEKPTPSVVEEPADADLTVTGDSVPVVPRPAAALPEAAAAVAAAQAAAPAAEAAAPAAEAAAPAAEAAAPAAEAAAPAAEAAAPAAEAAAPAAEAAAPEAAAIAPAAAAPTPDLGAERVAPEAEEAPAGAQAALPAAAAAVAAAQAVAPEAGTALPAAEVAAPESETAAPLAGAAALDPQTKPPVDEAAPPEAETVAKGVPIAAVVPPAGGDGPPPPRRRSVRTIALASAAAVIVIAGVGTGLALSGSSHTSSSHQGALAASTSQAASLSAQPATVPSAASSASSPAAARTATHSSAPSSKRPAAQPTTQAATTQAPTTQPATAPSTSGSTPKPTPKPSPKPTPKPTPPAALSVSASGGSVLSCGEEGSVHPSQGASVEFSFADQSSAGVQIAEIENGGGVAGVATLAPGGIYTAGTSVRSYWVVENSGGGCLAVVGVDGSGQATVT
jgi:eukaryotic-like serine/threonine-protein kinase